jgi:hypothetical protein
MGTIKIGCIDVVHATRDSLSQKSGCSIDIWGRPPYQLVTISPRELRTATHAVHVMDVAGRVKLPARSVCSILPFLLELFVVCSEEN